MIHMIGNAHIDPVWLWLWQEGYQEVKATFRSALDRMKENSDYIFTAACADYYRWVEENAPDMFEEIRARVKEGRWRIVGGMWIQPDCNIPSGESFARQLLYSQRYFRRAFGITVTCGYNVDSFGHNANLPALLARGGITRYVFQRPNVIENPAIPESLFKWVAPDGSSVLTYRLTHGYTSGPEGLDDVYASAHEYEKKTGYPQMGFYGVGNHGGGPTVRNIAAVAATPDATFSHPDAYFDAVLPYADSCPVWKSELQHHASGCYSATSLIKKLNRDTENALVRSEIFSCLSHFLTGGAAPDLSQAWKDLLFNQFHDILCGCAIREAYDDAAIQLGESRAIAARSENAALQRLSWAIDTMKGLTYVTENGIRVPTPVMTPVVVFNPHPFPCDAPVQIRGTISAARDDEGNALPVQTVRASRTNGADKWDGLFKAPLPPMGYRLFWVTPGPADPAASPLSVTEHSLSNGIVSAAFDPLTGALVSLKKGDTEFISAPALPRLIDIEHCDTWAHAIFTFDKLRESFGQPTFRVLEQGPVRATLRVTTRALSSTLTQDYTLYAGHDDIEVKVTLDMQEDARMLKLCFPVTCETPETFAQIAGAAIERVPDGCEETMQMYAGIGDKAHGLALLNDGKYSFSAAGCVLRFTVANTSIYADHYGQHDRDETCVHADKGIQTFRYALVPFEGTWQDASLARRGARFNIAPVAITETYHAGSLPAEYTAMSVNADNISLSAFKFSEDGDGFVLRLAESAGRATNARISLPCLSRAIDAAFTPFEIKSFLIPRDGALPVREVLFTEW